MQGIKGISYPKFQLGVGIMFDGMEGDDKVLELANYVLMAIHHRDEPMFIISAGRLCRKTGPYTKKAVDSLYQKTMFVF